MVLTIFHRATNAEYPPPCDVASLPVVDQAGLFAGYVGFSWGDNVADDAIHQQVCDDSEVDAVLTSWGLRLEEAPAPEFDIAPVLEEQ